MFDYLTHDVSRRRDAGETVAVLFIDLDGLKPLNDTYGHEVGDTAILATAMALMQATDECDVVGRLGGDEFLVVLVPRAQLRRRRGRGSESATACASAGSRCRTSWCPWRPAWVWP